MERNDLTINTLIVTLVVLICAYVKNKSSIDELETVDTPPLSEQATQKFTENCNVAKGESCIFHEKDSGKLWKIGVSASKGNGTVIVWDRDNYAQGTNLIDFKRNPGGNIIINSDYEWNFYHQAYLQGVPVSYR